MSELDARLNEGLNQAMTDLAEFRRQHPPFHGVFYFASTSPSEPGPFVMVTRCFYSDTFFGKRGLFRPTRSAGYRDCVALTRNHIKKHPGPVCSWEESRAYWKPRLEAETWEDWLHQEERRSV